MKIEIQPQNPRTLAPITLKIVEAQGIPVVKIYDAQSKVDFFLELEKNGPLWQKQFWLSSPGDYTLNVNDEKDTRISTLSVQEQKFLNFSVEFGIFSAALIIVAGGLVLWLKRKQKMI